ncbi:7130_t:CDS:1, partial [Cetraspora pellucida]
EYINDTLVICTDRNLKSCKEALWKLIDELLMAFNQPDPKLHPLFQNTTQNYDEGFLRLFICYNIGTERINNIYKQDIEKTMECNTTGRRARNIIIDTIAQQKQRDLKRNKSEEKVNDERKPKKQKSYNDINRNVTGNKDPDPSVQYQQECKMQ